MKSVNVVYLVSNQYPTARLLFSLLILPFFVCICSPGASLKHLVITLEIVGAYLSTMHMRVQGKIQGTDKVGNDAT